MTTFQIKIIFLLIEIDTYTKYERLENFTDCKVFFFFSRKKISCCEQLSNFCEGLRQLSVLLELESVPVGFWNSLSYLLA